MSKVADVVIVGGGAAGLTVAALLRREAPTLSVTVVEPSEHHYYQPGWTLVGAGQFKPEATRRATRDLIPAGVQWLKDRVVGFDPDRSQIQLDKGGRLAYHYLVTALGLQLDWGRIEGLESTLGANGVTSNYRYDLAPYTARCLQGLTKGPALFTQPAMPIKCAGAPQKILYMAADRLRRRKAAAELHFFTPGPAMFGIPFFAKALDRVVAEYGIQPHFGHTLVAVDGPGRTAWFERSHDGQTERIAQSFELLHVVPPQSAPDVVKQSPLADASGWVSVDKHTLQHVRYPNVFGLGDCTTTPNSKTAAAVRAQAPVLVENLIATRLGREPSARYDGYASCPLTTSVGRIMLAEFAYDGVITPSFPVDPRIPRRAFWWLKKGFLPRLYWSMLGGRLGPDWHRPRSYPETVPAFSA